VSIDADHDNPKNPYKYAADQGVNDYLKDYTGQSPQGTQAGPLDPIKYQTLKESVVDANQRTTPPKKQP
jgi:hypothetical protein